MERLPVSRCFENAVFCTVLVSISLSRESARHCTPLRLPGASGGAAQQSAGPRLLPGEVPRAAPRAVPTPPHSDLRQCHPPSHSAPPRPTTRHAAWPQLQCGSPPTVSSPSCSSAFDALPAAVANPSPGARGRGGRSAALRRGPPPAAPSWCVVPVSCCSSLGCDTFAQRERAPATAWRSGHTMPARSAATAADWARITFTGTAGSPPDSQGLSFPTLPNWIWCAGFPSTPHGRNNLAVGGSQQCGSQPRPIVSPKYSTGSPKVAPSQYCRRRGKLLSPTSAENGHFVLDPQGHFERQTVSRKNLKTFPTSCTPSPRQQREQREQLLGNPLLGRGP